MSIKLQQLNEYCERNGIAKSCSIFYIMQLMEANMSDEQVIEDLKNQLEYAETHDMRRAVQRITKALSELGVEVDHTQQLGA